MSLAVSLCAALAQVAWAAPPILVLRPDGVQQLDARGQAVQTWSPRPARWAHRLAEGGLVVDEGPAGLLRVSPRGEVTALAWLPPVQGCSFGPAGPGVDADLTLRAPWDAQESLDGAWLCLALEDAAGTVRARYDVALATGAVEVALARGPGCPAAAAASPRCDWAGPPVGPPAPAWPFRWEAAGARLVGPAEAGPLDFCQGRPVERCGRPVSAAVSASGRWRLLRLPAGADGAHPLFALDHQTGALFSLAEGRWPPPLDPTQRARLVRDPQAVASLTVGPRAPVFAIEPGERFGAGEWLVSPGQRVQRVGPLIR